MTILQLQPFSNSQKFAIFCLAMEQKFSRSINHLSEMQRTELSGGFQMHAFHAYCSTKCGLFSLEHMNLQICLLIDDHIVTFSNFCTNSVLWWCRQQLRRDEIPAIRIGPHMKKEPTEREEEKQRFRMSLIFSAFVTTPFISFSFKFLILRIAHFAFASFELKNFPKISRYQGKQL